MRLDHEAPTNQEARRWRNRRLTAINEFPGDDGSWFDDHDPEIGNEIPTEEGGCSPR